ncbi:hypothetical protein EIP86_009261 [Pleurotus ostreatoroseus]|nr:hypothetical protein EIP86_009261 [Pleurotus ostreatoroseus]
MSLAPDVQRKAQAELDDVLGSRLPTMDDLPSFPYLQAVLLETMRWCPITPTGVAHRLLDGEDDEFRGYIIPAGSTIVPNIWCFLPADRDGRRTLTAAPRAMLHNPADYPQPEHFNPERFLLDGRLNPKVKDPLLAAFGFGRRYLAMDSLTLSFASILSVFYIESTLPEGRRQLPEPTTGLISSVILPTYNPAELVIITYLRYPADVPCRLKPRTAACEALITAEAQAAAASKL